MAKTFSDKYHVPAVVINGTLSPSKLTQVIRDILDLKYQIILISPESLLSRRVREELLTNDKFKKHVLAVVIDEVHCVSFWSITFRKKYGLLHLVRSYLPKSIPFIGLSATLSARVLRDIASRLHMPKGYQTINLGNERPEVSIIVRRIKFPLVSCKDLAFLIDVDVYHPLDILKTFVYVDSKAEGYRIICFLTSLLPVHLRNYGIIRPFNARHSVAYREEAMQQFQLGNVRILVCTDAAGMGCDIADIDQVVQWRVTGMSPVVQRFGRPARGKGRTGRAILLAEPSAYTYNPTEPGAKETSTKGKFGEKAPKYKRQEKAPLKKGAFTPTPTQRQPELHEDSPLEGALAFIQTRDCRRKIWSEVFQNPPSTPIVDCCDICVPALLDLVQPPKPSRFQEVRHKRTPKKGVLQKEVQRTLYEWRDNIWTRNHDSMSWGATALLSNTLVDLLSSIGPVAGYDRLRELVAHKWGWWDAYGQELFEVLGALTIRFEPTPAKPPKKRTAEIAQLPNESQTRVPRNNTTSTSRRGQRSSGAPTRSTRSRNAPPAPSTPSAPSAPSTSSSVSTPPASLIYSNFNLPAVQSAPAMANSAYIGPPTQHHYYTTSHLQHQTTPSQQFYAPNPAYHPHAQPPFPPIQQPLAYGYQYPPRPPGFPSAPGGHDRSYHGAQPYGPPPGFHPYFPPPPTQ